MTPSRWKASMLIYAIISQHWHGAADAFLESWKISRRFLQFLYKLTTALASRKNAIAPNIQEPRFPFPSLTSFNCAFGHSLISSAP